MSQTLHILRKDLKRLRWLVLIWAVVLLVRVGFWSTGTNPTESLAYSFVVNEASGLIGVLQILMLALVAARLVHEEPLVGWDAFWLTRPYARSALIAAKLLFAAGVLIVLPLVADLWTMAIYHAGMRAQVEAAPTFISSYATWTLLLLAFAVVTPSLGAFVLAIVASVAGVSILLVVLISAAVLLSEPSTGNSPAVTNQVPALVGTLVVDGAMLAAITYQYRRRRWPIAVIVAAVGFIAALGVPVVLTAALGTPDAPDPGAWWRNASAASVAVDRRWHLEMNRRLGMRDRQLQRQVFARVQLADMPRNLLIQSTDVESTLTLSGVAPISSRPTGGFTFPVEGTEAPGQLSATRAALGDVALIRGRNEGNFAFWPPLVSLSPEEYARVAGKTGRLDLKLRFNLNGTRLRGLLPLRAGAALDDGVSRVEILRAHLEADGLVIAVRRWQAFSPVAPRQFGAFSYVALNRSRGEALTANDEGSLLSTGGLSGSFPLSLMGSMIAGLNRDAFEIQASQFRYLSRIDRPDVTRTFDAAWFDGAELAVLQTGYVGSVTRTVTIDDFTVPVN